MPPQVPIPNPPSAGPHPSPRQPLIIVLFLDLPTLDISNKWNYIICDPFWLNLWIDADSRIQRAGIKLHSDFQLCGGSVSLSPCCSRVNCSINSHFSPLLLGNIGYLHILYLHILICNMGCYENYM